MKAQKLKPAVIRDMPDHEYHRLDACSNSRLNDLHNGSPAHCFEAINNPRPSTPDQVFGTAAHFSILQPDLIRDRYVVVGQCQGITQKKTQCKNTGSVIRRLDNGDTCFYCGLHDTGVGSTDSRVGLSQEEFDACFAIRDSAYRHPSARRLLEARTDTELTVLWNDHEQGILCKGRIDGDCAGFSTIFDVKTSISASLESFQKSIFNWGYHRQQPMYINGMAAHKMQREHACFIVAEKVPPYAVAVFRLREDVIEAGYFQLRQLIKTYAECKRSGRWPGYPDDIQDIALPKWAWAQMGLQEGQVILGSN